MHLISKLSKYELVNRLPKLTFEKYSVCDVCQLGKQTISSFKSKGSVLITKPLELLHLNLFGPVSPSSVGGKSYILVIIDD